MSPEITCRIRDADDLPSLPQVAIEVLRLAQAEDASLADIGRVVQNDPALTGKLLKVVNSSLFGMSRKISSLHEAMVVLGLRTVRVMVLSFSLVDEMNKARPGGFNYRDYWRRSITTAVAARLFAENSVRAIADEAFISGLLCDIGMLAAARVAHDLYDPVLETHHESNEPLQSVEQQLLGTTHEAVSEQLLGHWGLPEALCSAVGGHHQPFVSTSADPSSPRQLANVVRAAARIADLFCSEIDPTRLDEVSREVVGGLGISDTALRGVLESLDGHVTETASLFSLNISTPQSYHEIQTQAAAQLARLSIAAELERAEIAQREEAARQQVEALNSQNRELAQLATTDALTGLANRAAFEQHLAYACTQGPKPLGLILLDADHFKEINDTHGHRAGDLVLKLLGQLMIKLQPEGGLAARYGGEEFALIVPGVDPQELKALAETLRRAVANVRIPIGQQTIHLSASLGAVHLGAADDTIAPERLVELADSCLYDAKRMGRNRAVSARVAEMEARFSGTG